MVRKLFILMAVLGLAAFGPMSAGANLIDFDTLPVGNIDGLNIGPASPDGVVITSADGSAQVFAGSTSGGFTSPLNNVSNQGYMAINPLVFTFEVPRGYIAFVGGDRGGDQDRFVVNLFDINNNNFYTFDSGVFGGGIITADNYMNDQVSFEFTGPSFAKRMEVLAYIVDGGAGIHIDDLQYCQPAPTPIPGSLLLLGSGILGLVGVGRRKISFL